MRAVITQPVYDQFRVWEPGEIVQLPTNIPSASYQVIDEPQQVAAEPATKPATKPKQPKPGLPLPSDE